MLKKWLDKNLSQLKEQINSITRPLGVNISAINKRKSKTNDSMKYKLLYEIDKKAKKNMSTDVIHTQDGARDLINILIKDWTLKEGADKGLYTTARNLSALSIIAKEIKDKKEKKILLEGAGSEYTDDEIELAARILGEFVLNIGSLVSSYEYKNKIQEIIESKIVGAGFLSVFAQDSYTKKSTKSAQDNYGDNEFITTKLGQEGDVVFKKENAKENQAKKKIIMHEEVVEEFFLKSLIIEIINFLKSIFCCCCRKTEKPATRSNYHNENKEKQANTPKPMLGNIEAKPLINNSTHYVSQI